MWPGGSKISIIVKFQFDKLYVINKSNLDYLWMWFNERILLTRLEETELAEMIIRQEKLLNGAMKIQWQFWSYATYHTTDDLAPAWKTYKNSKNVCMIIDVYKIKCKSNVRVSWRKRAPRRRRRCSRRRVWRRWRRFQSRWWRPCLWVLKMWIGFEIRIWMPPWRVVTTACAVAIAARNRGRGIGKSKLAGS